MTTALRTPLWLIFLSAAVLGWWAGLSAQDKVPEHQVKAAFLFNFAKFVQWPQSAFLDPTVPLTIGIYGKNPFKNDLRELVDGKTLQNRKIVVRESSNIEELKTCQIVFLATTVPSEVAAALVALEGLPILTVSDCADFLQWGGMIRFFIDKNKVRFEIKPHNLELAGLSVSSKLLKVATVVADSEGGR
jgi:hypothetical protein